MIITKHINIDLATPGPLPQVYATQDDKYSRNVEISLYENGVAWEIPAEASACVRYIKPDGTGGNYNLMPDDTAACSINGNTIIARLAPQVCTAAGMVRLTVCLVLGNVELNVFPLRISVQPNPDINVISMDYNRPEVVHITDVELTQLLIDFSSSQIYRCVGVEEWMDVEAALQTVENGGMLRVSLTNKQTQKPFSVLLDSVSITEGVVVKCSGTAVNCHISGVDGVAVFTLQIYLRDIGPYVYLDYCTNPPAGLTEEQMAQLQANTEALEKLPVSITEDGYTEIAGQRKATSIRAVMEGNTVTITTIMQGDVTHTDVITLDENGYPVSIMADGVECAVEFVGFGETEGTETTEDGETEGGGGE